MDWNIKLRDKALSEKFLPFLGSGGGCGGDAFAQGASFFVHFAHLLLSGRRRRLLCHSLFGHNSKYLLEEENKIQSVVKYLSFFISIRQLHAIFAEMMRCEGVSPQKEDNKIFNGDWRR